VYEGELIENKDKIHISKLACKRIKQNLKLQTDDILNWCRNEIEYADKTDNITREDKKLYVAANNSVITINASNYAIITANLIKKHKGIPIAEETPEDARCLKISRDWYAVIVGKLDDWTQRISIYLLNKGLSIENVYEALGFSEIEKKRKNKRTWNVILTELDKRKFDISYMLNKIFDERFFEIANNLLNMRRYGTIELSNDDISKATGLTIQQIEYLNSNNKILSSVIPDFN